MPRTPFRIRKNIEIRSDEQRASMNNGLIKKHAAVLKPPKKCANMSCFNDFLSIFSD